MGRADPIARSELQRELRTTLAAEYLERLGDTEIREVMEGPKIRKLIFEKKEPK